MKERKNRPWSLQDLGGPTGAITVEGAKRQAAKALTGCHELEGGVPPKDCQVAALFCIFYMPAY